ncbi:Nuclear control of ATPase protein 2, partial [Elasticomyces elasticus]
MSIVDDQIRRLDAVLDKYQADAELRPAPLAVQQGEAVTENGQTIIAIPPPQDQEPRSVVHVEDERTQKLKAVIRSLSTSSNTRPLVHRRRIRDALALIRDHGVTTTIASEDGNLEWLAIGKATVQVYGTILNVFLDQTIPLSESIWYWDDILSSYMYTGLYTLQTAPLRSWTYTKDIYADTKRRFEENSSVRSVAASGTQTLSQGWREFYDLVQTSIDERSLRQAQSRILSPFALCRAEARGKQDAVKKLRTHSATAIGLLVDESVNIVDEDEAQSEGGWRRSIIRSIQIMEATVKSVMQFKDTPHEFEESVIDTAEDDWHEDPVRLADKLLLVLDQHLPAQEKDSQALVANSGMPPRLVRYWIPGLVLLLSGSTLLRLLANRREEILTWIRELGSTTIDFWYNWVVDPVKRLIATIRHDENSELAIMSKDSLRSDRESLERMVVDFAVAHPENGTTYTATEIDAIRTRVRQGDLSAVLKAYEKDMQSPARGAIFGSLVQSLLIQVQKTKVDVEVAMNGIDEILKSQELLFGFVGVAPGIAISFLVFRWLSSSFGNRRGLRQSQQKGDTIRLLRNINRTLSNMHVLRQRAAAVIPSNLQREFVEDIGDLMDTRQGVRKQLHVIERIQW